MKFEFTENEINIIYGALQELPFKTVADVINTINRQFNEQKMELERQQENNVKEPKEKK